MLAAPILLIENFKAYILTPIVQLLFAVALGYFLFGLVEFLWKADRDDARSVGTQHMLWGVIGIAIMVSVYGIMKVICTTIGCA